MRPGCQVKHWTHSPSRDTLRSPRPLPGRALVWSQKTCALVWAMKQVVGPELAVSPLWLKFLDVWNKRTTPDYTEVSYSSNAHGSWVCTCSLSSRSPPCSCCSTLQPDSFIFCILASSWVWNALLSVFLRLLYTVSTFQGYLPCESFPGSPPCVPEL